MTVSCLQRWKLRTAWPELNTTILTSFEMFLSYKYKNTKNVFVGRYLGKIVFFDVKCQKKGFFEKKRWVVSFTAIFCYFSSSQFQGYSLGKYPVFCQNGHFGGQNGESFHLLPFFAIFDDRVSKGTPWENTSFLTKMAILEDKTVSRFRNV